MATRAHGGTREHILDFSANINPMGPPAAVREALFKAISDVERYPDPACAELKRAISLREGIEAGRIVCGNGAAELLFALFSAVRPARAVIPVPSFCEYQLAAAASGADIVLVPPRSDGYDLDVVSSGAMLKKGDMCVICTPNNPTGRLLAPDDVAELVERAAAAGALLVVDEAFIDFVPDRDALTAARLLERSAPGGSLLVLRSMTKFWAIPGVRLGYALTSPELASRLELAKDPWSVNTFAQAAGVAALGDEAYAREAVELIAREREWLSRELAGIPGLAVTPGACANFLLLRLDGVWGSARCVVRTLASEYGVAVRDCSTFDCLGSRHIRVAVKDRPPNARLVEAFRSAEQYWRCGRGV